MTIPEDDLVRPMHSVHIPVMGTAFTIDTPIRVAPYGISSVISICDDELCETMRQWWTEKLGWQYTKIKKSEDDPEVYAQLSKEFIDTYWSKRDDDLKDAVRGLF